MPRSSALQLIRVHLKRMQKAYELGAVLASIPKLDHGNDGLIFTSMKAKYTIGTDNNM